MDTSKKVNANAGKGGRYMPSNDVNEFGQANRVGAGAGVSGYARIRTQAHGRGSADGSSPQDISSGVGSRPAPGMSVGNAGPHPAGVAGSSPSVAGRGVSRTMSYPGDGTVGRRDGATEGAPVDRYRKKY